MRKKRTSDLSTKVLWLFLFATILVLVLAGVFSDSTSGSANRTISSSSNFMKGTIYESSLKPKEVIRQLKALGLREDDRWGKSKVENEWYAIARCFCGPDGELKSSKEIADTSNWNEINCMLTGPTETTISEVQIEVEIYDVQNSNPAIQLGTRIIETIFPDSPKGVKQAFSSGQQFNDADWEVKRKEYENGSGYSIVAEFKAAVREVRSAKTATRKGKNSNTYKPDKTLAWVMCQRVVKKGLASPSTASFGPMFGGVDWQDPNKVVSYLGVSKYEIRAWVDAENALGAKIRQKFTVVIKQDGESWQGVSLKFDE